MSNIVLNPSLTYGFEDVRDDLVGDGFDWNFDRATTQVEYVVVHHSAGPITQTVYDIAKYHVEGRGWGGIGYHFVIHPDGKVFYCGDLGQARANVLGKNEKVIGVCLIGDFTEHLATDQQIVAAHELCKFLLFDLNPQFPNLGTWDQLAGHMELQATSCPGNDWAGPSGLRDRIINNIPYTPPTGCEEEIKKLQQEIELRDQLIMQQEKTISEQSANLITLQSQIERIDDIIHSPSSTK